MGMNMAMPLGAETASTEQVVMGGETMNVVRLKIGKEHIDEIYTQLEICTPVTLKGDTP